MGTPKNPGICNLCGKTFSRGGMSHHLKTCLKSRQTIQGQKTYPTFWISVWGKYYPEYWLHLEIRGDTTLSVLDQFLRDTWLECCGHLSSFTIKGVDYMLDTGLMDSMWMDFFGSSQPPRSMKTQLSAVLETGLTFDHIYDFGTSTYLKLKVNGQPTSNIGKNEVVELARNLPPEIPCFHCGKPATLVCVMCIDEPDGWICDDCIEHHECEEDYFLPVVNSPRVGECGYTG
jgi:hypothetical protein